MSELFPIGPGSRFRLSIGRRSWVCTPCIACSSASTASLRRL